MCGILFAGDCLEVVLDVFEFISEMVLRDNAFGVVFSGFLLLCCCI